MNEIGQLVVRACNGDADSFERLVRLHLRAAYTVALGVTNDPADAEDVAQDSFIAALERIDECKQPDRFSGWLLAIVRNRALNHRRAQTVRAAAPLAELERPSSNSNPERDVANTLLREDLTAAMAQLTELQRQVVLLHDLEGYRHREIGDTLGISEGSSRFHLFAARAALRTRLTAHRKEDL